MPEAIIFGMLIGTILVALGVLIYGLYVFSDWIKNRQGEE